MERDVPFNFCVQKERFLGTFFFSINLIKMVFKPQEEVSQTES